MQTFKVRMSEMVNGEHFSFSMEYEADSDFAARVLAYREFGDSPSMNITEVEVVSK